MQISTKDWLNYINKLSSLNNTAGTLMRDYVAKHGFSDTKAIIDYAYALVTKYGEGSAALAAEMYDAVAEMSGKVVPVAEVADTASYKEIAKAVYGTLRTSKNPESYANIANRYVKRAGADTTLKNAERDGAQFAWVPFGDTCSFCITLASRGFQNMSKKAYKNGHAEHIHANCDCAYTVRFDNKSGIKGYDPDKYLAMYRNAEGDTPQEKINAMRRMQYQDPAMRNKINAQKREAYAERKKAEHINRGYDVTKEYFEDATPGKGLFDTEPNFENKAGEKETANIIFKQLGGDIVLREERKGQKNPDYLWMDRLWDLKTISSEKAANSAIKTGMKQIQSNPGGIILNMGSNNIPMDSLKEYIDKRMAWYPKECADIMVISNGKIIKILRY